MASSNWRTITFGLLLTTITAGVTAQTPTPRPVTDEIRESLSRVVELATVKAPEAVRFAPHQARFVRVVIQQTSGTTQPCIDELEIYGADGTDNLALAKHGAVASASSLLPGYAIHQIAHLNDGLYGNDHSWIAASNKTEWAQIELPTPTIVASVLITRDRTGQYRDRIPQVFEVRVSLDGQQWQTVGRRERSGKHRTRRIPYFQVDRLPERTWRGFLDYTLLRERTTWSTIPADDPLSPLRVNRPAVPDGAPYWGRIARLAPLERVLVLFEQLIQRLDRKGLDIAAERAQLAEFRRQAERTPDSTGLYLAARHAKRQLFFRDPALAPIQHILFTKRHPYLESHNYSEHLDGVLEPGGGVFVLHIPPDEQHRFRPDRARIERLFDATNGIAREPVSDFDARTVYFAYRPDKPAVEGWSSYWHLYSMRADGSHPRQLTDGPFHDFDAACLPDGGVAFNSTRCKVRFLCWRPQAYVLYRMNADGTNIKRLSYSNLSEWTPTVMRSGRILWTRSEYLDKGADFGHTLWAIHPDGTYPELIFGNNTPNCYGQAHEVPDSQELVCTLMSHGDHSGPIALIDLGKGPFATAAITNITPDTPPQYQMSRSYHDTFRDPYPISPDLFLVAHTPDDQYNWGLYVIDRYGNREWLYADPEISSYHPTPLRPRRRPPVLASTPDAHLAKQGLGQFTVQDVYEGLGAAVARGQVKYLQVSEEVPATLSVLPSGECRADYAPFTDFYATPVQLVHGPPPSYLTRTPNAPLTGLHTNNDWPQHVREIKPGLYRVREGQGWPTFVAKAVLGTVPVAEDGSVNFLAPAGKVLYFHLLDADYNELQRMRSVVQLQPGERRSCVGCHDSRVCSPSLSHRIALTELPQRLQAPPWGSVPFDYQKIVQPVFDARCVRCHDGTKPNRPDLRATLDSGRVPTSYRTLIEGGWVHYFDLTYGMRHFKAEPLSFGTVQSRLWTVLADTHHKQIVLDRVEQRALKAWTDLNCPLWPDYQYRPERPQLQTAHVAR